MKRSAEVESSIVEDQDSAASTEDTEDTDQQQAEQASTPIRQPRQAKLRKHSNGRQPRKETEVPTETFFDRLRRMSEADWEKHRVYCYRRWPKINKQDQPIYIGVHRQAIDEEVLKNLYGSGQYLLKLNDQKRTIEYAAFEIQDMNFPPKLNPDELVSCAENERYFKLWPAESKQKPAGAVTNGSDSAVKELAGVLKMVLEKKDAGKDTDEAKTALNSLIDWALRQKEKEREENSPKAFAEMMKELKGILPTPAPATAPAPQTDVAALLRLAKELQPPAPPPAPNPLQLLEQAKGLFSPPQDDLAHIDRLLSIADKLSSLRGRGGEGQRSGWDIGLDYVRELTPLAQYFGGLFGLRMPGTGAAPARGAVPGTTAPASSSFDPYARPDLLRTCTDGQRFRRGSGCGCGGARGSGCVSACGTGERHASRCDAAQRFAGDVSAIRRFGSFGFEQRHSGV
jgi:hypothetical protein